MQIKSVSTQSQPGALLRPDFTEQLYCCLISTCYYYIQHDVLYNAQKATIVIEIMTTVTDSFLT